VTEIAIVGGGAAGFFAAIAAADKNQTCKVSLYERSSQFLSKVRISGGGRCNVTHALSDLRTFTTRYPRGERELISPFHRFSAADTVAWFEARGVRLKREGDGRMFPITDSSETIIDCLINEAKAVGVRLFTRQGVEKARVRTQGGFELKLSDGKLTACEQLLLATGGARDAVGAELARSLGHAIEPPVPSLFSLHTSAAWLRSLPGISIGDVEVSVEKLCERGPLLITHNGVSGPAVLRLSAWGARILHEKNYRFTLRVNWIPELTEAELRSEFQSRRKSAPTRRVFNSRLGSIPARLWEKLASNAGILPETNWSSLTRAGMNELIRRLRATELKVDGKSLNKEEFVTCGGVRLREINFKTMQSRIVPDLYFAGELLDIDGITGGFNFQAAWTTGWIAGHAMAQAAPKTL
jgi:predicted Rossmann fold flavoprotein